MLSLGQSLRPRDLIGTSLSQPLATFLPSVPPSCFSLQITEQTASNPSFTHVGGRLSWKPGQGATGFTSASLAASSQVPGSQGHWANEWVLEAIVAAHNGGHGWHWDGEEEEGRYSRWRAACEAPGGGHPASSGSGEGAGLPSAWDEGQAFCELWAGSYPTKTPERKPGHPCLCCHWWGGQEGGERGVTSCSFQCSAESVICNQKWKAEKCWVKENRLLWRRTYRLIIWEQFLFLDSMATFRKWGNGESHPERSAFSGRLKCVPL